MNPTNLQSLITDAIEQGINQKRLHLVTGLNAEMFEIYHRDMLFTFEQSEQLAREIKGWRRGQ